MWYIPKDDFKDWGKPIFSLKKSYIVAENDLTFTDHRIFQFFNMKGVILFLLFVITMAACKQADTKTTKISTPKKEQTAILSNVLEDSANFTTMYWLDSTYQDLGKVEEGQVVDVAFRFKNTGVNPLIIPSVSVSCGCTTIPVMPNEQYAPGQEGVIKAKFDSKNMAGQRLREVYVKANTKESTQHILVFRVEVIKN